MARPGRIMLSAGEVSGDRLGAGLVRELLRLRPDLELFGMGGERMAAEGVRLIQHSSEVAVVGILEVLSHLPAIRRAKRRLEAEMEDKAPDLLVPIDFPDFNLRLSSSARRIGVPVVYFVSPQLWAWRAGRVKVIRRLVRRMLVLFPFETRLYEDAGVPVSFVGHPLAEIETGSRSREAWCREVGLDPEKRIVALMPGSRRGEVERLLPVMLEAGNRLARSHADLQFLIPAASGLELAELEAVVHRSGLESVWLHAGDFPEILTACEAGVVAVGTASLEAGLIGLPIVVVHRINPVSYALGKRLVRLENLALPNLVAGRRVVPELIQADCTPEGIAEAIGLYLEHPDEADRVRRGLTEVRTRLGGPGAYARAAQQVLDELDRGLTLPQ